MLKRRGNWIDIVKIYACILVVLGHFFQSMVTGGIVSYTAVYGWFNQTIYFFHVPLFFVCSGFLYQNYTLVRTPREWCNVSIKKVISLGIPYFIFSFITWGLKVIFPGSVNEEANGLLKTLFLEPISPYWYLYALVLLFLLAFTIKHNREAVGLILVALLLKCFSFIPNIKINALRYILGNEIWFVLGMQLSFWNIPVKIKKIKTRWLLVLGLIFLFSSIVVYAYSLANDVLAFILGLLACFSTITTALKLEEWDFLQQKISLAAKYLFPVFLMHTIFAAGLRSVLFKIGISNSVIHIVFGIIISFVGPVIAAMVMSKVSWMEFFLYPNKFVKKGGKNNA